jgi:hypothetical protein
MTDQRIRELETENNRLRSMLARAGISILPSADVPNDAELDRLLAMVAKAHPCLREADRDQFAYALHFLAHVYRVSEPNTEYAASYWTDMCKDWLGTQGYPIQQMGLRPFVAAAVASGIVYGPLDEWPYGINLGISLGSAGRPSTAWRDALKCGVPQPVQLRNRAPIRAPQNINVRLG